MPHRLVWQGGQIYPGPAAGQKWRLPVLHLILSNPPYICENDDSLSDEVLCDPALALYAGADGLAAYRALLPQIGAILADKGQAFRLEIDMAR